VRIAAPLLTGGAIVAFVLLALPRAEGAQAVFAAALLGLVAAAAVGPSTFVAYAGDARWRPAVRGVVTCAALALALAAACAVVAFARQGPWLPAIGCGLFCGLYALAGGAVARLLGGGPARVLVAGAGLALLCTLFFWDDLFLLGAPDRKVSAATAFAWNPAAAASVTLGFDWIHAPGLYTGNQTCESLFGVPLAGIGSYAWKLLAVTAVAAPLGMRRTA